jgi:hypothetical protein
MMGLPAALLRNGSQVQGLCHQEIIIKFLTMAVLEVSEIWDLSIRFV